MVNYPHFTDWETEAERLCDLATTFTIEKIDLKDILTLLFSST
jgi:hypothetical protein